MYMVHAGQVTVECTKPDREREKGKERKGEREKGLDRDNESTQDFTNK